MEVLCYTRHPKEDMIYADKMAYSMHLAYRGKDGKFYAFHHNEGLLYAKAVENTVSGVLDARSLKNPWIFALDNGGYGVVAVRTMADGKKDVESEGCILFFTSRDLVHYEERGLFCLQEAGFIEEIRCVTKGEDCQICWKTENGGWMEGRCIVGETVEIIPDSVKESETPSISVPALDDGDIAAIEGIVPGNTVEITGTEEDYLLKKLLVPVCVGMELSKKDPFDDENELKNVKAIAHYSDGTRVERKVDWEKPAGKAVKGKVHQEHFPAPFAENRADPVCMYRDGKYYFIATNDADGNRTLYMRCSDTLEGISQAEEVLFLDSDTYPGIGGLLWAPEFHQVGGNLYVFHAATSGEFFCEESRVRKLKAGGNPICKEDWSEPVMVVKKDGTPLCEEGKVISLDMTVIPYGGKVYAMWSQRQFLPVDQGAWLYLAEIDEKEPWKLLTDPVCIAKPEYGWENNHTYVVEGPYALYNDGQLMVTYAAAAVDATYTVGLLKPRMGSDILDSANWKKNNYPLMSSNSVKGQYGTGHNSYVTDENGLTWNFYHMRENVNGPRSSAARRVYFDIDGEPMLDVVEEIDLPDKFRWVEAAWKEGRRNADRN